MQQEFIIETLETNLIEKKIIVNANMDINPNSKDELNFEIYDKESRNTIFAIPEIKGKTVEFNLREWPKPNTPYIFFLKELKNVLNEKSRSGIRRRIEFKSTISKEVKIISPNMHEAINDLKLDWHIIKKIENEEDNPNEYLFVEISSDNTFINIVATSKIYEQKDSAIKLNKSGQYFVRARVESLDKELQYGKWSEVISFIYGNEKREDIEEEESEYIPEYDNMVDCMIPEIDDIDDFKIEYVGEPGITPETIMLMANKDIDEDEFESSQIMIYSKKGIVKHSAVASENIISIEFSKPLEDNAIYTLKAKDIKSISGDIVNFEIKIATAMKPLYCDIYDVTALIGDFKIPEDVILHHIHDSSKFADYIYSSVSRCPIDEFNVPFNIKQFVKYHAAHECMVRYAVDLTSSVGLTGKVGNVEFGEREGFKDITGLLKHFCDEIDKWKDSLRGFDFEGRAMLRTAVKGKTANPAVQPMRINRERSYGRGDIYGQ